MPNSECYSQSWFVCQLVTLWKNGWTDWNEIFKIYQTLHKEQPWTFGEVPDHKHDTDLFSIFGVDGWFMGAWLLATLRTQKRKTDDLIVMIFSGNAWNIWGVTTWIKILCPFWRRVPCVLTISRKHMNIFQWNYQDRSDTKNIFGGGRVSVTNIMEWCMTGFSGNRT